MPRIYSVSQWTLVVLLLSKAAGGIQAPAAERLR